MSKTQVDFVHGHINSVNSNQILQQFNESSEH